jgi:RHS repeat-associated protein
VSANDYSAFGAPLAGRTFTAPNISYRFGFNGKENDEETQNQDYGMRIYDYRLGKFLSIDPLTKYYPMLTPYQFASNTPIMAIDLDGCEAEVVIYGTGGLRTSYGEGHDNSPPDGKYIMNCGVAGANRMGVKAKPVRSGKHLLGILTTETIKKGYIASMVYYGHSWFEGLYLYQNEGFYQKDSKLTEGSSDLNLLADFGKKGFIKIGKSSTFVFASCGTMYEHDDKTFASAFSAAMSNGYQLDKTKKEDFFSITVVGANNLVNIKSDGNALCEFGSFIARTTTYKAEKEFKDITFFGIKIGSKATTKITEVSYTEKDLGKTIDPAILTN